MRMNIFPSFYPGNFRLEIFDTFLLDVYPGLLFEISYFVFIDVIHSQG